MCYNVRVCTSYVLGYVIVITHDTIRYDTRQHSYSRLHIMFTQLFKIKDSEDINRYRSSRVINVLIRFARLQASRPVHAVASSGSLIRVEE